MDDTRVPARRNGWQVFSESCPAEQPVTGVGLFSAPTTYLNRCLPKPQVPELMSPSVLRNPRKPGLMSFRTRAPSAGIDSFGPVTFERPRPAHAQATLRNRQRTARAPSLDRAFVRDSRAKTADARTNSIGVRCFSLGFEIGVETAAAAQRATAIRDLIWLALLDSRVWPGQLWGLHKRLSQQPSCV